MCDGTPDRRAAVYRLYDASGALLYIGSAYDPEERCKAHRKCPWWPEVAHRTETWLTNRVHAYREEMKAIAAERPPHNVMGTPAFAALATEGRTRRNELASLRQKLIAAAGQVQLEVRQAAREAGASPDAAKRAGALAEIEFLQWTGLFSGAIKRRRERLELYGW